MDLVDYENFVYSACLQDWDKLGKEMNKISKRFEKGNEVHLIGENVDLKFSIEGKNVIYDVQKTNFNPPTEKRILDKWVSGKFDLIFTSPPYADQRKKTYGGIHPNDYVEWFLPKTEQMLRVLKPTGTFVLNIKEKVGKDKVVLGLSGGVDSSVAAILLNKAIGNRLHSVFVNNGLLREGEADKINRIFKKDFNIVTGMQSGMPFVLFTAAQLRIPSFCSHLYLISCPSYGFFLLALAIINIFLERTDTLLASIIYIRIVVRHYVFFILCPSIIENNNNC